MRGFCGGHSNRLKRFRRLSGKFFLLEAPSLTKDCLLGLQTNSSLAMILWSFVRRDIELTYRKKTFYVLLKDLS